MNDKYVAEIDLVNMMIRFLGKWRTIILMGILGMALFTGVNYISYLQIKDKTDGEIAEKYEALYKSIEEKKQEIRELELENENFQNTISITEVYIDQQKEYVDNSLRMEINPVEEYFKEVNYIVSINEEDINIDEYTRDPVDEILAVYVVNVREGIDYPALEEKYDTEKIYIEELISINADYLGNMITIQCYGVDEDMVNSIMSEIISSLEKYRSEIASYSPHELFVISEDEGIRMDRALLLEKSNIISEINENSNICSVSALTIEENNTELTSLNKELEKLEKRLKNKTGFGAYQIVKNMCIGLVLGAMLYMMFFGIKYVMNARLYTESDIRSMGIEVLGVQWTDKKYKGLFAGIDKYIDKLSGRVEGKNDEYLNRACDFLNASGDIKNLVVISSLVDSEKSIDIVSKMKKYMSKTDIVLVNDFINNGSGIKAVCNADYCILVESTNKSKVNDILHIIDDVEKLEKKIYGAIVIKD